MPIPHVKLIAEIHDTFFHGSRTVGVTQVQLIASSIPVQKGIVIKASNSNTGNIYVGNTGLTINTAEATDGFELGPGESLTIEPDNVSKVYLISDAASQRVYFVSV